MPRASTSIRRKAIRRLGDVKAMPIDYAQIEKDAAGVKKKFNEVFQ